MLALGHGNVLAGTLALEASLAVAVMAAQAPDRRGRIVAKGVLTTPIRYGLMLTELYSMLQFIGQRSVKRVRGGGARRAHGPRG